MWKGWLSRKNTDCSVALTKFWPGCPGAQGNCRRGVPHWREMCRLAPSSIIVLQLFRKSSPANGCQLNAPLAVGWKGLSWREIPMMPLNHDMPISLIIYLSVFWFFLVEVSLNLSLIASLWVAWYHQSFYSIYVFLLSNHPRLNEEWYTVSSNLLKYFGYNK